PAQHVSPEPEGGEQNQGEDVQESSQKSESLFTSASDRDNEERQKWLEEEKENEKLEGKGKGKEENLNEYEPEFGYATPRRKNGSTWGDQELDPSTPKPHAKKGKGKDRAEANGSLSKRQPFGTSGPRGNNVQIGEPSTSTLSVLRNKRKRSPSPSDPGSPETFIHVGNKPRIEDPPINESQESNATTDSQRSLINSSQPKDEE
ncbi:hypothetical protein FRC07_006486, partial [Ceratobasidium sp. 392]